MTYLVVKLRTYIALRSARTLRCGRHATPVINGGSERQDGANPSMTTIIG